MTRVYVAAGSNIDPQAHLTHALSEVSRVFGVLQVSPWYRNAAVGFTGEDFINFVFGFDTGLNAYATQAQLREVEARCGRPPNAPKWAARAIDLDMLLFGELVQDDPQLQLPRPDLLMRPYMLGPLADIAASLRHPTVGKTIGELWAGFDPHAHAMITVRPAATVSPCA